MSATILIADDSAGIRMLLEFYLEQKYKVLVACDGKEAMEIALKEKPDLIVMDMQMPVCDGLDACRILRTEKNLDDRTLPIIALSGSNAEADLERAREIGCNDFISKPVDMQALLSKVKNLLQI